MKLIPLRLGLRLALVCLGIFFSTSTFAGDEWRPITPEELALKTAKVEPDADAEAIFWEVRIDDSSDDLSLQHYIRVKVFTDRGREKYSKFDIPFSKGMKIKDIAARVIKQDGSTIEIQKQEIFEREILRANGLKVKAKSFAVPNLQPGVIVEYRYREVISDAGASGMHLKFQRDIPAQSISYYYKPYNKKKPNYQSFNFDDTKFVEAEKGFWVAQRTNTPALKEEPRMPPENQVVPWMLLQTVRLNISAERFGFTISIKDPSNQAGYWGAVGNDKSFLTKFMNKPDKEVKRVATEVVGSAQEDVDRLRKLYEFCQAQIRNTTFDSALTDDQRKKLPKIESIADVLKQKTASAQFVDLLFGAMANSLGYETRIMFSADRSEMFFKPEMTNESFIHPAAIAVNSDKGWKFFNPGTKFLPYGMLLWYEENVWALLVGDGNYTWIQVPMTGHEKSRARRNGKFTLTEDGSLEGDVRIEYTGQPAIVYRMENYESSDHSREEDLKQDVRERLSTAEVSNMKIENLNDPNKPLVQTFKIRIPQYAQKTGKRLFLQPSFFEYGRPAMFSSNTRKYDVYFHYPWSEDDNVEIDLPPGYALDNAEKPPPFGSDDISQYKVTLGITTDKRTLILHREFFFGGGGMLLFQQTGYSHLKLLFDRLHQSDEHTITLKQASSN